MNPELKKVAKNEAGVFWQFACGHALTGYYLKSKLKKTKDDSCWHCNEDQRMTRGHLFSRCKAFKEERKEMERGIRESLKEEALEKGKTSWRYRIPVREYFARECVTGAVMEFIRATKIGRTGRPPDGEGQA